MSNAARYEILTPLATGDFATVYRGRDAELGREVAIKQIHAQFLSDPRQLDLYWKEAQLLASLEHPHIMTIYDLVRPKGWLILELMKGTVAETARGEPLDLDVLREVLVASLQALAFLHSKKVIHGDIKPTNLFFDRRGQVKIGDFGLARRATSDQGSLLKGTTRYMAPELVSDQFGPVGPHSDLYSLGFSAFELMCGSNFEQLFPGIGVTQDKQLAWIMWHAAADRRLPEISRVLEGVPPDLAQVIQRLTQKNTQQRYRSAAEALRDLKTGADSSLPRDIDEAEEELARQKAAKKKRLTIGVAIGSMLLSTLMLVFDFNPTRKLPAVKPPEQTAGVLRNVLDGQRAIIVEVATSDPQKQLLPEFTVRTVDRVVVNDKVSIFQDLQPGDQITVKIGTATDDKGHKVNEFIASRPKGDKGVIKEIIADEDRFILKLDEGAAPDTLGLSLPAAAEITINGKTKQAGQPIKLANLKLGDRVTVQHFLDEQVHRVRSMTVLREVSAQGIVRQVDVAKQELTFTVGSEEGAALSVMPLAPKCEISLNGLRFVDKRTLTSADLRAGDKISFLYDILIKRIDAQRQLALAGTIKAIRYDVRSFDLAADVGSETLPVLVAANCPVQLGGEMVAFDELRRGDHVTITHDSADKKNITTLSLDATRPADPTKALVIVANEKYDDTSLGQFPLVQSDAEFIKDGMVKRYAIPADQTHFLKDETRIRLEQALPQTLEQVRSARQLIVYYSGAAFTDETGVVYLAPRECSLSRLTTTCIPLKWLIDRIEASPVPKKLLLLDVCRGTIGVAGGKQPSTAEMVETIRGTRKSPGLKTLDVIASCSAKERGRDLKDQQHGAFAYYIAQGFSGAGDKNRDLILDTTEIADYLKKSLADAGAQLGGTQTPVLFQPDTTPLRITKEAKDEIEKLALALGQPQIDFAAATQVYEKTQTLAPKQPEPKVLYAIALYKAVPADKLAQLDKAALQQLEKVVQQLTDIKLNYPKLTFPWELAAWIDFERNNSAAGIVELTQVIGRLPAVKTPNDVPAKEHQPIFEWAGKLREYGETLTKSKVPTAEQLAALDAAVERQGIPAAKAYKIGRDKVSAVRANFDTQMENAPDDAKRFQLRVDRHKLKNYMSAFPFDTHIQRATATLDD